MTPQQRDKYLQKKYGITLVTYNTILNRQGGVCYICRKPSVTRSLAVDHDHKWRYVKIAIEGAAGCYGGSAVYLGRTVGALAEKRADVTKRIRMALQRMSVRGLLCPHCNSGLRKYSDDPIRFERAAQYLRQHQDSKYLPAAS